MGEVVVSMSMRAVWVGILSVSFSSGCGSEDEAPPWRGSSSSNKPVAGCEAISHASCDVRAGECQERLLTLAACIRQDDVPPMPPVTVMSEAEFADVLYELYEEQAPQPAVNHFERALVGLHMVEPGAFDLDVVVEDLVQNIGGIYRHDSDDIVIVDHGAEVDRDMMSSILVHEFVHYLQDRDVDLEAFTEAFSLTSDSSLAASSIVEGEAEFQQLRYYASLAGMDPNTVDYRERFESMVTWSEDFLLQQPSPYTQIRSVFPYAWGGRYVQAEWAKRGRSAVTERFAVPPTQTRTLMAVRDGVVVEDVATRSFDSPSAPAGFRLFGDDVGGAFMLFLYLTTLVTPDAAYDLALEWRGDRLSVFATSDDAGTALAWRIAFADAGAASRFATAVGGRVPSSQIVVEGGTQVVFAIAEPAVNLAWALAPLD